MNTIIDLKPDMVLDGTYEGIIVLDAWKGFQSRRGFYGSQDQENTSDGEVNAYVNGYEDLDGLTTTTQAQVNAIQYLVDNGAQVRDALLIALLKAMPALKEIYEDLLPHIETIDQFKNVVGIANLHISPAEKDGFAYIGFELGCDWDEEHGVGVMLHKDRVIEIGGADISFNDWIAYTDNGTQDIESEKRTIIRAKEQAAKEKKEAAVKEEIMKMYAAKQTKPWWKFW